MPVVSPKEKELPNFLVFVFLSGLCLILYARSLPCGFVIDSNYMIAQNPYIKQPALYKNILTKDFFAPYKKLEEVKLNYYRPVVLLSYIFDYRLWRLNAGGYRFTNILIHGLNGFLLYLLFWKLFAQKRLAFLISFIFCILPVHEWNVNEIAGRTSLLQMTFSLLSLIKLINFLDTQRTSAFVLSLLYFILALLSREMAVFFGAIVFVASFFHSQDWKKAFRYSLPFGLLTLSYLLFRYYFLPVVSAAQALHNNFSLQSIYQWLAAVVSYSIQFILPRPLAVWNFINLQSDIRYFLVVTGIFLLVVFFLLKKMDRPGKNIWALGAFWMGIGFLPLYFAIPQLQYLGSILFENHLYLPAVGFSVILGYMISRSSGRHQKIFIFLLSVYYCVQLSYDNSFWRNEKNLFRHFMSLKGKNGQLVEEQLFLKYEFQPHKALEKFRESKSIPQKANWLNSLGINSFGKGFYPEARGYFDQSQQLIPNAVALRGLGAVCFKMEEYDAAIQYLQKSLGRDPESNFTYRILGMVYYEQNQFQDSERAFRQAVFFDPDDLESWLKLGMVYFWEGKVELSQQAFKESLELVRDKGYVFRYTGVEFYHHGQGLWAAFYLEKAAQAFPRDTEILLLLGKIYSNLGYHNKAFSVWQKAGRIDPNNQELRTYFQRLPVDGPVIFPHKNEVIRLN